MKHILITGSTDGIGKLTALMMAKEGHTLYLHGRNPDKLNSTIADIKLESGNDNITGFVADLSDLSAVKTMANEVIEKVEKLDVLLNNAGVFKVPQALCKQGYDLRFTVNYLAPYLLMEMLLPLLEKANNSRIINLSSAAQAPISYPEMLGQVPSNVSATYAQSKLALTMWSFSFAQTHKDIVTIAVNPGSLLNTKMAHEAYGQYWSPAEKGAQILFDLCLDEAHSEHSGEYFDNDSGHYNHAHPDAYNEVKIQELINKTKELIA